MFFYESINTTSREIPAWAAGCCRVRFSYVHVYGGGRGLRGRLLHGNEASSTFVCQHCLLSPAAFYTYVVLHPRPSPSRCSLPTPPPSPTSSHLSPPHIKYRYSGWVFYLFGEFEQRREGAVAFSTLFSIFFDYVTLCNCVCLADFVLVILGSFSRQLRFEFPWHFNKKNSSALRSCCKDERQIQKIFLLSEAKRMYIVNISAEINKQMMTYRFPWRLGRISTFVQSRMVNSLSFCCCTHIPLSFTHHTAPSCVICIISVYINQFWRRKQRRSEERFGFQATVNAAGWVLEFPCFCLRLHILFLRNLTHLTSLNTTLPSPPDTQSQRTVIESFYESKSLSLSFASSLQR